MRFWNDTVIEPVPPDSILAKFSAKFGIELPEYYEQLLQEYNGAKPLETAFDVMMGGKKHTFCIDRFLGILPKNVPEPLNAYDVYETMVLLQEQTYPDVDHPKCDLLPIAVLFDGDLVCLDYRKGTPTVCIWSHEESQPGDPVTYHVADSFNAFINGCYEETEYRDHSDVTLCDNLNENIRQDEIPCGYIWHFTEKQGEAQLVPFLLHMAYPHTGGRAPGMWADYR